MAAIAALRFEDEGVQMAPAHHQRGVESNFDLRETARAIIRDIRVVH